jgi:hypothetical protein
MKYFGDLHPDFQVIPNITHLPFITTEYDHINNRWVKSTNLKVFPKKDLLLHLTYCLLVLGDHPSRRTGFTTNEMPQCHAVLAL